MYCTSAPSGTNPSAASRRIVPQWIPSAPPSLFYFTTIQQRKGDKYTHEYHFPINNDWLARHIRSALPLFPWHNHHVLFINYNHCNPQLTRYTHVLYNRNSEDSFKILGCFSGNHSWVMKRGNKSKNQIKYLARFMQVREPPARVQLSNFFFIIAVVSIWQDCLGFFHRLWADSSYFRFCWLPW